MKFGSVCSGIEAASVAWHPLGWKAAWLAEIEPFPSAVLAHHYPDVPNLGDMTKLPERILSGEIEAPDLFCGGTPCQAFSVAGLRNSLDDARGNLSLTFCEIANAIDTVRVGRGEKSAIIFWENVPGVLSTKDNAFGCFLGALAGEVEALEPPGGKWTNAGCVSGPQRTIAWRVLDAQYFGVAQRRRRVFVVASARNDFDPAAVLFEFDGVRRDSAPSRQTQQDAARRAGAGTAFGGMSPVAGTLTANTGGMTHPAGNANELDFCVPVSAYTTKMHNTSANNAGKVFEEYSTCLDANSPPPAVFQPVMTMAHRQGGAEIAVDRPPTLTCNHEAPIAFHPTQDPISSTDGTTHGLGCGSSGGQASVAVAFQKRGRADGRSLEIGGDVAYALTAPSGGGRAQERNVLTPTMAVRRLTPVECERLQGFPTVSEKITIEACLDHQNQRVHVALKCHKWQNSAWPADASELQQSARTAVVSLSTSRASQDPLVALHVRMHSVDELLEVRSLGRSIWSASGAAASNKSLPPTLNGNTVQELARLLREVAHSVRSGKAASPLNISLSFPASFGATSAEKFGPETAGNVSDATKDQSKVTFTTSDLGLITTSSDSTAETLCCSALHAIAGCIPETTLPVTFSIELTVETPYTAIPWRKKPASECPDGPRYKALGNSWAVPNVAWIGRRIANHITQKEKP